MDSRLVYLLLNTAAFTIIFANADSPLCRKLERRNMHVFCYQSSVYDRCRDTCFERLLDAKYVSAGCPWGNSANVYTTYLDKFCKKKITSEKCGSYCRNPKMATIRLGWQCCKTCVDVCGKMPSRDTNFKRRYPNVYPQK
ncbi:uncharacterized protein LOC125648364 [Ostrea edulis]|uniref:uncharacterized protein LOC125648364 n=1 Tax=Ostrea edulis TaxID=37623 RepID=UPI0024AF6E67|nr:uncharacterized protein LOC125648364 [Ostrea edulis]